LGFFFCFLFSRKACRVHDSSSVQWITWDDVAPAEGKAALAETLMLAKRTKYHPATNSSAVKSLVSDLTLIFHLPRFLDDSGSTFAIHAREAP
jgi:hypothetical protein